MVLWEVCLQNCQGVTLVRGVHGLPVSVAQTVIIVAQSVIIVAQSVIILALSVIGHHYVVDILI
jgi:type IV secretory pathway VirB3-like protein